MVTSTDCYFSILERKVGQKELCTHWDPTPMALSDSHGQRDCNMHVTQSTVYSFHQNQQLSVFNCWHTNRSSCPDNGQCPSKDRHDSSSVREDNPGSGLHCWQHHTAGPHIAQHYNKQALLNVVQLAYQLAGARNLMFCFPDDVISIWNCIL